MSTIVIYLSTDGDTHDSLISLDMTLNGIKELNLRYKENFLNIHSVVLEVMKSRLYSYYKNECQKRLV